MKSEEIRKYAELMKELNLSKLSITEKGMTLFLERPHGHGASGPEWAAGQTAWDMEEAADRAAQAPDGNTAGLISVTSPMVGVFYASPAENADPFVSAGTHVREGDVLCIIEAMKLMNEIRAEESGIVEKVCVANGQLVEYGTELMRIRKE